MTLEIVHTEKAPRAIGPYSQAIRAGHWLFVSGQIPLAPGTGELVEGDFEKQVRQALENFRAVVEAAEGRLDQVTAVDVFLTDIGMFAVFNRIYEIFFDGHKPARAVVEVRALPRGASVELKGMAYLGT